ncbi:SGNH/GDSL hydrolase family protein [Aquincola tertiaricarbonis]|uniref:SGNH/GDSL hydrolase family protein n=1 Tax=Aquincola tertiaricarbonis TaxID=391953 RepID=UPI000697DECB|nr:SGNH/GDSL hydrolase family protein [Aquincola tertiaricarbonis]
MQYRKIVRLCAAVLAVGATTLAPLTQARAEGGRPVFTSLFVFGDSLSDTGNSLLLSQRVGQVPALPPSVSPHATYWQGRFSNGPVAVEHLWRAVGPPKAADLQPFLAQPVLPAVGAVNFAFGGAISGGPLLPGNPSKVPTMLEQVGLFQQALGPRRARADGLYVVWGGGNDYAFNGATSPEPVVRNVVLAIQALHAKGARRFLVPNLPDMGLTPLARSQGQAEASTLITKAHNALLAQQLATLSATLPGVKIVSLDVFKLGEALLAAGLLSASPPALAVVSPNSPAVGCLFLNPMDCVDVPLDAPVPPVLFWDMAHPTTQVHGLIAMGMVQRLLAAR